FWNEVRQHDPRVLPTDPARTALRAYPVHRGRGERTTGLTKSTSLDGRKYDIACCQIDIGNAHTDLAARMANGVPQANGSVAVEPLMHVAHVASAVVQMANLPLDANVQFLTIMATKMPYAGRG